MTDERKDLIERWAREAGVWIDGRDKFAEPAHTLERFAAIVRADALEEAAKVCENIDDECPDCASHNEHEQCYIPPASAYADAIRTLMRLRIRP